jgi:hypothetical protein
MQVSIDPLAEKIVMQNSNFQNTTKSLQLAQICSNACKNQQDSCHKNYMTKLDGARINVKLEIDRMRLICNLARPVALAEETYLNLFL